MSTPQGFHTVNEVRASCEMSICSLLLELFMLEFPYNCINFSMKRMCVRACVCVLIEILVLPAPSDWAVAMESFLKLLTTIGFIINWRVFAASSIWYLILQICCYYWRISSRLLPSIIYHHCRISPSFILFIRTIINQFTKISIQLIFPRIINVVRRHTYLKLVMRTHHQPCLNT